MIKIYMNQLGANAFPSSKYPVGAVIVKEKRVACFHHPEIEDRINSYGSDQFDGVGGMIKREPGFDPDYGDWEYFYFEDASEITRGKIQSCIACHEGARENDFVFGSWKRSGG